MTQNNTLSLEEAKKLLNEWRGTRREDIVFLEFEKFIDRLITAARIVQRAEDAEIIKKLRKNTSYSDPCGRDSISYAEQSGWNAAIKQCQTILTPEAPLSDNQKSI